MSTCPVCKREEQNIWYLRTHLVLEHKWEKEKADKHRDSSQMFDDLMDQYKDMFGGAR